jgi:hypothetical protein
VTSCFHYTNVSRKNHCLLWESLETHTTHCVGKTQGRPETSNGPGQSNSFVPFKPTFFKLFRPRTWLAKLSEGGCPKCGTFSEKFFRPWQPEMISTIFPIIPETSQRYGQLALSSPSPYLANFFLNVKAATHMQRSVYLTTL